jgi:hypothetical protein
VAPADPAQRCSGAEGDEIDLVGRRAPAAARAAFGRALAIFERFLGPEHPNTRIARGHLESLGGG